MVSLSLKRGCHFYLNQISLTVFTQQIGRGLRISEGKTHCTTIDLIGNYRNADMKLKVFTEDNEQPETFTVTGLNLPEECYIHLDTEIISLLYN